MKDKDLAWKRWGPAFLSNLNIEDRSRFRNFKRMEQWILTCWRPLLDSECTEFIRVNEITFTFFLACWFLPKRESVTSKSFWQFSVISTGSRFLGVSYFSSLTLILRQKRFHCPYNNVHINSYVGRNVSPSIFLVILIFVIFWHTVRKISLDSYFFIKFNTVLRTTNFHASIKT